MAKKIIGLDVDINNVDYFAYSALSPCKYGGVHPEPHKIPGNPSINLTLRFVVNLLRITYKVN